MSNGGESTPADIDPRRFAVHTASPRGVKQAYVREGIGGVPLLLVHGRDDHFFDEEQAWLLYRRAGEPKRLMLASRFGHAEDGYTSAFARHISAASLVSLRAGASGSLRTSTPVAGAAVRA